MVERGRKKTKKRARRSGPAKTRKVSKSKKTRKKPTLKKRRTIPMGNARVVEMQKEFLRIEEEILKHMASREPEAPRAKYQIEPKTYFAGAEERMAALKNSLKRLRR